MNIQSPQLDLSVCFLRMCGLDFEHISGNFIPTRVAVGFLAYFGLKIGGDGRCVSVLYVLIGLSCIIHFFGWNFCGILPIVDICSI